MTNKDNVRLARPYAKGQITIPADFRQKLGIDENTILQISLKGAKLEITPLRLVDETGLMREYDSSELAAFLEEDRIDPDTAERVRQLLAG